MFSKTFSGKSKMDIKSMSKIRILKKVCRKMFFSYANKPKTLFSKMRAFSRKITFLHFFGKIQKKRTFLPAFYIFGVIQNANTYKYFITINAGRVTKLFDYFDCTKRGAQNKKNAAATVVRFSAFFYEIEFYGLKS